MITVRFYTLLRLLLNQHQVDLDDAAGTVANVLEQAQRRVPTPFLHKLRDESGALIKGSIILVNGRNILHTGGLDTGVKDGDDLALFPPGGGG